MRNTILTLLLVAVCGSVQAQQLTLDDCRRMAVENSRNLKIAGSQQNVAEDNLKMYKANFLPKFSFSGNYLYSTGSFNYTLQGGYLPTFVPNLTTGGLEPNILTMGPDGTPIFKQYAYMPDTQFDLKIGSVFRAGLAAQQPIYMGGKVRTSVKMAKIGKTIADLNLKKTETEVVIALDEAFFTCIKMEELVKSAVKYNDVVSEFYRQMENAHHGGLKSKNDLLKVQVKLNEAQLQLRQAQNGLRLARMNLCYHIGLPMTTSVIELVDNFEPTPKISSIEIDISSRPEYVMLQQQIELKKQQVALVKSDFLPQVGAMVSYNYTNGVQLNNSSLFSKPSFMGGVSVSIPLFNWGEGRRKVSAARHEVDIARNQFEDLAEQMQLELMQAITSYDESTFEVALTLKSLVQSEENMTESGNRYETGMESLADYLEAQALWQKAQSDLVEARSQQRISYTKYLKATGAFKFKP